MREALEWALSTGHQSILLDARLFGARLARDEGDLSASCREANEGLRAASICGFGQFQIDFEILLSDLALREGEAERSIDLASAALRS